MPDQESHKHGQESYCQVTQHRLFNGRFSKFGTDITSQDQGQRNHNHWVEQQYLPDVLKNTKYYTFGENKNEQASRAYWARIKGEENV